MDQLKTQGSSKAADRVDRPGGLVASSVSRSREAVSAAASEAMDAGGADLKALLALRRAISRRGARTRPLPQPIKRKLLRRSWRTSLVAIPLVQSRAQSLSGF